MEGLSLSLLLFLYRKHVEDLTQSVDDGQCIAMLYVCEQMVILQAALGNGWERHFYEKAMGSWTSYNLPKERFCCEQQEQEKRQQATGRCLFQSKTCLWGRWYF